MGGGSSNPHQISGSYPWVDARCRESLHRRTNGRGIRRARRSRFRSADGQRVGPHDDFGDAFIEVGRRVTRASCGRRAEAAGGRAPRRGANCAAAVAHCEGAAGKSGMDKAGTRPPPDAGPVAGPHLSPRPVGRHRPGPHCSPEPSPRSPFPHSSQHPEPNGEPLPTVQNYLVPPPVSICGRRWTGYGSIVTAWSRGTAISIGPGAAGMLWGGGRTTGRAGPV
ncbi:hypothetical protein ABID95_005978 [Streptomyces atratus]